MNLCWGQRLAGEPSLMCAHTHTHTHTLRKPLWSASLTSFTLFLPFQILSSALLALFPSGLLPLSHQRSGISNSLTCICPLSFYLSHTHNHKFVLVSLWGLLSQPLTQTTIANPQPFHLTLTLLPHLNLILTSTMKSLKQVFEVVRTSQNGLTSQICPHFLSRIHVVVLKM